MRTITIGIVGAAGNVGTHMAAFFANSVKSVKEKWGKLSSYNLSGHYPNKLVDLNLFETAIVNAITKKYVEPTTIDNIDIKLILFLHGNSESSIKFRNSDGFGFFPIPEERDFRILIPKSDFSLLGIEVIDSIMECQPGLCDLVIATVTEDAILNEKFICQLNKIVTPEGYIAISMNGLPPYFLHLMDQSFSSIDFRMNRTIPAPPEYPNSINITEALGGPQKLIGVVLTVADNVRTLENYHISCANKSLKDTHLHSRAIEEDCYEGSLMPKNRLGNNFFYHLGIASGLNTHRPTDFLLFILQKLQVNFILNPISAIYPVCISDLLANDSIKKLIKILNEQFIKMTHILGLQDHALLKGDTIIARLEQSSSHIASTGQKSLQLRKIEYVNLSAFLHLVKSVAHRDGKKTTNLQETISLYNLFEKIHFVLNQDKKTEESVTRIKFTISNLKEQFTQLVEETHLTAVASVNSQQYDIDLTAKSVNVLLRGLLMSGMGGLNNALTQLESSYTSLKFFASAGKTLPEEIKKQIREQHARLQYIVESFNALVNSESELVHRSKL